MATYNGDKFILEQMHGILSQLSETDEVIVSDDGSCDNTCAVIEQINDDRIRLFCHTETKGPVKNFEFALQQAKGEIIFLADQDDIWEKKKISTMQTCLATYDLVVSDCSIIDLKGDTLYDSFFLLRRSGPGILKNLWRNGYIGCCMAFKRHILEQAVPLPKNVPMHDWWIGLVAASVGTTFFLSGKTGEIPAACGKQHPACRAKPVWHHSADTVSGEPGCEPDKSAGITRPRIMEYKKRQQRL
jgi:glycosyltransferase involved in cell wall biosynthesis